MVRAEWEKVVTKSTHTGHWKSYKQMMSKQSAYCLSPP